VNRVLVVPFNYSERFRLRSLEFALRWVPRWDVIVWRWQWLSEVQGASRASTALKRLRSVLSSLFRRVRIVDSPTGLRLVDAPILHPALLRPLLGLEGATRIARRFNSWQLLRVVERLEIDCVVLSSAWFDLPKHLKIPVFYDVVDWFNEDGLSPGFFGREMIRLQRLLSRTAGNSAVSRPLVRKLATQFGISCRYLPNGVDVRAVRGVRRSDVDALRQRLSLQDSWVLGCIGNHDLHAGLDFLLEMFSKLRERTQTVALVVVGPYDVWKGRLRVPSVPWIRFTGPLPPGEIPLYCNLQDLAVHPCEKSQFRDYALPLKVIEASAARKHVLSTDLLTLRDLELPNVCLAERSVDNWVAKLETLRHMSWRPEWDRIVEFFDWERLSEMCADWIEHEK
jgi:glycosyltransferase involved in cell wall biosynthesis